MSQAPPPQQQPRYNPSTSAPPSSHAGRGAGGRGMNPVPYGVHPAMGPTPPHLAHQQQQQQQQQQMQQGGGMNAGTGVPSGRGNPPMGAWQPAAPTSSLQQASATANPYHHPPPYGRGSGASGSAPNAGSNPPQGYHPQYHNPYYAAHTMQHHPSQMHHAGASHNPYMGGVPPGRPGAVPGGSTAPNSSWQPLHPAAPQHYGQIYYPQAPNPQLQYSQQQQPPNISQQMQNMQPPIISPPPREKKIPVITDKHGNVVDFSAEAAKMKQRQQPSSLQVAATAGAAPAPAPSSTGAEEFAAKLKQTALDRISGRAPTAKQQREAEEAAAAAKKKEEEEESAKKKKEEAAAAAAARQKEEEEAAEAARKKEEEAEAIRMAEEAKRREAELLALKQEEEAKARLAAEQAREAEELRKQQEEQELAKVRQASASSTSLQDAAISKPIGGLRPGGLLQPKTKSPLRNASAVRTSPRHVYTKEDLLRFKELEVCQYRPDSLPDMTIVKGQSRGRSAGGPQSSGGGGGGGGGGGSQWARATAAPRRTSSGTLDGPGNNSNTGGGGQWARGQAPPKPTPQQQQQKGRNRGGQRGTQGPPLLDGPVAPLLKSENRWMPQKNASAMIVAEKKVKAILNKMTKEKFDKLSDQMCEIPILSFEMLTMIIHNVYEKAIDEPSFGDMYADLCVKLSQTMQANNFVKIIESDEDPPTEDEEETTTVSTSQKESSSHTVYRWSNDVSTTDAEVVGPLESPEECIEVALSETDQPSPIMRGEMELELDRLLIKSGTFIKILRKKHAEEGKAAIFYTVYFPVSEAKACGQQLSKIFLSDRECVKDSVKDNSFKSVLLNKCEDEFNKQDIYVDWKKEKKEYDESKSTLSESERVEKEGELGFRRIRIKKQMLGNIKFIGQLYKKGLLKEKIMRYCVSSLLKLESVENSGKNVEYKDMGDNDMDEEDHEALCNLFITIGSKIEKPESARFMNLCFQKIEKLSNDKNLSSRSRFMYKDLIDLRTNNWVPRRAVENAKTLEEIRKDVEIEERHQAQQSQQMAGHRGVGKVPDRDFGRGGDNRGKVSTFNMANRPRPPKPSVQADEEGFTLIGRATNAVTTSKPPVQIQARSPIPPKPVVAPLQPDSSSSSKQTVPVALSRDTLERRIKSITTEFINDPDNVNNLLMSMDELSGTPDANVSFLQKTGDKLMDCKDHERRLIMDMLKLLYVNEKFNKGEIQEGLADLVEFIPDVVPDCPKAYDYLGELLSLLLQLQAIDIPWLCVQCEKANQTDPDAAANVIRSTVGAMKRTFGADVYQSIFGGSLVNNALSRLLGSDWRAIAVGN